MISCIDFFKNKSRYFNATILYELQPINLMDGEILYQQNEIAESIFFILNGKFKLIVDLNEYIKNEDFFESQIHSHKNKNKDHGYSE